MYAWLSTLIHARMPLLKLKWNDSALCWFVTNTSLHTSLTFLLPFLSVFYLNLRSSPMHLIYLVGPLSLSFSLGFCLQAVITWSSCGMWLVESQWCALTQCILIWSTAPAGTETALRSLLPARTRNYECSIPARAPSSLCVHAFNVKNDNANQKRMHRG